MNGVRLYTNGAWAALHYLSLARSATYHHNRGAILATSQQA